MTLIPKKIISTTLLCSILASSYAHASGTDYTDALTNRAFQVLDVEYHVKRHESLKNQSAVLDGFMKLDSALSRHARTTGDRAFAYSLAGGSNFREAYKDGRRAYKKERKESANAEGIILLAIVAGYLVYYTGKGIYLTGKAANNEFHRMNASTIILSGEELEQLYNSRTNTDLTVEDVRLGIVSQRLDEACRVMKNDPDSVHVADKTRFKVLSRETTVHPFAEEKLVKNEFKQKEGFPTTLIQRVACMTPESHRIFSMNGFIEVPRPTYNREQNQENQIEPGNNEMAIGALDKRVEPSNTHSDEHIFGSTHSGLAK